MVDISAYKDEEGRTYYYNKETGNTTWDLPNDALAEGSGDATTLPELNYDEHVNDNDGITRSPDYDGEKFEGGDSADEKIQSPIDDAINEADEEDADGEEICDGWIAYKDDEGRTYYYNTDSGLTQWELPEVAIAPKTTKSSGNDEFNAMDESKKNMSTSQTTSANHYAENHEEEKPRDLSGTKDEENTLSQVQDNLSDIAERFLLEPDAVMEPSVFDHISTLVAEVGPQVAGPKAMQSLINGYQGDTAMCGLMGLWLAELKATSTRFMKDHITSASKIDSIADCRENDKKHEIDRLNIGANASRDVVEKVVNRLAKERFTKDGGDAIMSLSKKQAAFVDEMIESERWRNLLIDLSATNMDSKLFMYCLQSISNMGYHRAIANRINHSDYFGVFNSMLSFELTLAGKIAVDGYSKQLNESSEATNDQLETIISDLCRICTSTSYTYLYANEVLHDLISQSKRPSSYGCNDRDGLTRATYKWERLQEEIERKMLKPQLTGTTFQQKRRIDVVLAMSDIVQRQRRRINPESTLISGAISSQTKPKSVLANNLDSAIAAFLTKCSLGIQIDKDSAENVLKYAYGGSSDRIGDILLKHPSAITSLFNSMFGTKRIRLLETRLKCARLIALAVKASERLAQSDDKIALIDSDEDKLCQTYLKGSQLCEQVESMVSFTVLDNKEAKDVSVGRQLSSICIENSVVAQGFLLWAKDVASGSDFVTTAGYPTLSPCILSLARIICIYHPLTRSIVLEVALIFMSHSNREISHQKMQSIKEQCIRLMILLFTQGMTIAVINTVRNKLQKADSSEMDSALVRYFLSGIVDIVRPPFSLPFVREFSALLMERPCIDATMSQLFETRKQSQIINLIREFEHVFHKFAVSKKDRSLMHSLKTAYDFQSN